MLILTKLFATSIVFTWFLLLLNQQVQAQTPIGSTTIWSNIISNSQLTQLTSLLNSSSYIGFRTMLDQAALNLTFFAPTNQAIQNAHIDVTKVDQVNALLSYHLIEGVGWRSSDFITKGDAMYTTALNNQSYVSLPNNRGQVIKLVPSTSSAFQIYSGVNMNGQVTRSNSVPSEILCANGVIHMIDTIFTIPTLTSQAFASTNLSAYQAAIKITNLQNTLNTLVGLTVFAFSNNAWQNNYLAQMASSDLAQVLRFMLVPAPPQNATVYYTPLLLDVKDTTVTCLDHYILQIHYNTFRGLIVSEDVGNGESALIIISDIITQNGVIHVVDNVLPVPFNFSYPIAYNIRRVPRLTLLTSILLKPAYSSLLSMLADPLQQLTVFTPPNSAILNSHIDPLNVTATTQTLLYHIVPQPIMFGFPNFVIPSNLSTGYGSVYSIGVQTNNDLENMIALAFFGIGFAEIDLNDGEDSQSSSNGQVYLVSDVFKPPMATFDAVSMDLALNYITPLLKAHPDVQAFFDSQPTLTLFMPTRLAIQPYLDDFLQLSASDLKTWLMAHSCTAFLYYSSEFASVCETMNNHQVLNMYTQGFYPLEAYVSTSTDLSNSIRIQSPNVLTRGGVIHIIGEVLAPIPRASSGHKLSDGDIAGIVIGVLIAVVGAVFLMRFLSKHRYFVQNEISLTPSSSSSSSSLASASRSNYGAIENNNSSNNNNNVSYERVNDNNL